MKKLSILLAVIAVWFNTSAIADVYVEEVSFDCTGELVQIVETDAGPRATGLVDITIDLPNGTEWRSSGVVVIAVPQQAAGRNVEGRSINRCLGEAQLQAQVTDTINGVEIWSIRLDPTQIRLRIGNQRITEPTRVGFSSSAGGDPNV